MKKGSLLFIFMICSAVAMIAQVVPSGMKYQAVARDANGEILAMKQISLEIQLLTGGPEGKVSFSEIHQVTTNVLGLFDITIGQGKSKTGIINEVPWSSFDIWMNIGIDETGGQDFTNISTTKLLTVPYAFHAATADDLTTGEGAEKTAPFWKVNGNLMTLPLYHFVGTKDYNDLNFRTNDIVRMLISKDGDIFMANSLTVGHNLTVGNDAYIRRDLDVDRNADIEVDVHIGQDLDVDRNANIDFDVHIGQDLVVDRDAEIGDDLTVKQNVNLNTVGGQTLNNGNFTVTNQKATLLSGTLTVDLATDLNASLNVDGPSNLQSTLNVNNGSSTNLSGTLLVQDDATFNEHVLLDNAALSSTSVTSGALVVNGGVGIGENLNVGGEAKFGGPVEFGGAVAITDETESTSATTGALIVSGGVGVGKRLNVDGAAQVNNTFKVETSNVVSIPGGYDADLTDSGKVGSGHIAQFRNTGDGSGVLVQVGAGTPHGKNNFITFLNSSGQIVGRIEGENGNSDFLNNREYQDDLDFADDDITLESVGLAITVAEGVMQTIELAGAIGSSTVCVGLVPCVTAPSPGEIAAAIAMEVIAIANIALQAANLAIVVDNKQQVIDTHVALQGITFASGAEDYAEYLPKFNLEDKFSPGEVVGMKNGYISKNTWDADRIMVISHNPAVLGGLPGGGEEHKYEMVAFLGQIPTMVLGKVTAGDYILPSGNGDGFGIAKSPERMRADDYNQILGVAWENSKNNTFNMINVAVGLNTNDLTDLVSEQSEQIKDQKEEIESLKAETESLRDQMSILADLVPGFKEAAGIEGSGIAVDHDHDHDHGDEELSFAEGSFEQQVVDASERGEMIMIEITEQHFEEGLNLAKQKLLDAGQKLDDHPFWSKIESDASYKSSIFKKVKAKMDETLHYHNDINKRVRQN